MGRERWVVAMAALVCGGACGGAPAQAPQAPDPSLATPGAPSAPKGPSAGAGATSGANSSAEVDRAASAIKSGDFAGAKGLLEQALQKSPKNATALYYLGLCFDNLGDKKAAEQKYKDALAANADLTEPAINLAAIYLDAKRWDEVISVSEKALARRSDDPGIHANLAMALEAKGDKRAALAHYEAAVKGAGDNGELRYAYGALLVEQGDKAKGASELKASLAAAGSNRPLLASLGRALGQAGAFADCVASLDRAIGLGDDPELRVRRGLCRHALKDEGGASADFESAIRQNPKFAAAHYYLGESLLATGDAARAIKEFDAASAAAPQSELGKKAHEQAEAARKSGRASKK